MSTIFAIPAGGVSTGLAGFFAGLFFLGGGSSPDPCEEIYCGTKPFSEPESLALARYLYKHRRDLEAYMDVHTFGQLWMSPWGYTDAYPEHFDKQVEYRMQY